MNRILRLFTLALLASVILTIGVQRNAEAQGLIRDAEIENIIREYSTPLFKAAKLNPEDIEIYLINDKSLNAFVAGGQRMFIHTGLLLASESPGEVIGVIAHETGHISGGHLARFQEQLRKTSPAGIVSLVAGLAVGVLTGAPEAAVAVLSGGQQLATSNILSYSRGQEGAADQAGLKYLEATGQSAKGLREFMARLEGQELLISARQDPYVRTHPLTSDRIEQIESHMERSKYTDKPVPQDLVEKHKRVQAKIFGFLNPIGRTLRKYKTSDNSVPSRYARAIGYFLKPDLKKALPLVDSLIAEFPDDPYFHELKGYGLYRNGDAEGALASYTKAVKLLPSSGLMRKDLADVQLEMNDPELLDDAIANLRVAIAKNKTPGALEKLGAAYHRKGNEPYFRLARGEAALLRGNGRQAKFHSEIALKSFKHGSRDWLKAQDVIQAATVLEERQKRNK